MHHYIHSIPTVPNNLEVTHHDSKSANLTWDPPAQHCNCVYRGYRVKVVKFSQPPQDEDTNNYYYANTTHKSIPNLEPRTDYVFKVSTKTGCRVGPPASTQSTTPEGGMQLLFNCAWADMHSYKYIFNNF